MKKFFFLLITAVALFYFWSRPDSGSQSIKTNIGNIFSSTPLSSKDYSQDLALKQEELKAYEDALKHFDAQIEQWKTEAESKICPTTGQPGIFVLKDDPRPKLREQIDQVRKEIAELERKVKK